MAHPDLDNLLNALIPFANETLSKREEFHPFGAVATTSGEIVLTAAHDGDEFPPPQRVIEMLIQVHREKNAAKAIRASAICINSFITKPGSNRKADAISVCLEHQCGECVEVFIPYKRRFMRGVVLGEISGQPGTPVVFV